MAMVQVDKFLRNLSPRSEQGTANRIRQCSIRITDVCNLRCHTCGQWGDKGFLRSCSLKELKGQEVSRERYIQLLGDLKEQGHTPSVYLWGGEPMLYKGSVEIIEEAARLGMPPSIATNGTGLVEHAERLVSAPMFVIQISVDGPDAQTHNASRPGASASVDNFATITRAIDTITEIRKDKKQRLPVDCRAHYDKQRQLQPARGHLRGLSEQGGRVRFLSGLVDRRGLGAKAFRGLRGPLRVPAAKAFRLDRELEAAGLRGAFRSVEAN